VSSKCAAPTIISSSDAATLLQSAPAVLLVAGAGLSAAAGIVLPGGDRRPDEARWERYSRLDTPVARAAHESAPFTALADILREKPMFCFTTNIDGVLVDVFGGNRVAEAHGSVRRLQCASLGHGCPCDALVDAISSPCPAGAESGDKCSDSALRTLKRRRCDADATIPRPKARSGCCSTCHGPLRLNVSTEDDSDEEVSWKTLRAQMEQYEKFLTSDHCTRGGVLIVALGLGRHTHSLARDLPILIEHVAEASRRAAGFAPALLMLNDSDPGVCGGAEYLVGGNYSLVEGPLEDTLVCIARHVRSVKHHGSTETC
jgi:NAD-dependent SIR2 family protein deacetylase